MDRICSDLSKTGVSNLQPWPVCAPQRAWHAPWGRRGCHASTVATVGDRQTPTHAHL